ncbi:hypothetical protein CFP65_4552 [Kitasatospora sp. MMS16-BH015]|uniref:phosphotransferase n=1 Tax=Kitasatospora sp. MMS16-BH015 TaxID=2018025 RepID=UPI000CA302F7|nr:phosphotransferase [Kitasatospora sp. MMS16-BH015]AUG79296.1 hypothetical protein CFP65_4552 [Kitasatospora sp. MMS16-BH015]
MLTETIIDIARAACALADVPADEIEPIRVRDNAMLRIPGQRTVIRVHQEGELDTAVRELRAADWLRSHRVLAPEPIVPDPVSVDGRPVTFWDDLGPATAADPADTARSLRALHSLRVPTHLGLPRFTLPDFGERIDQALTDGRSKVWLRYHAAELAHRWEAIEWPDPWCVIHGDPSPHNTMATPDGAHLVDLERFSVGPRQWDQATVMFQSDTLADPPARWEAFRDAYGEDVTTWCSYTTIRDIRSFELALFALRHADKSDHARHQADYRLACLMGRGGDRPWGWVAP